MSSSISVSGLKKLYRNGRGVSDVSLNARSGGIHALLGQNGAGKSTTLLCIVGIERRDAGSIAISGRTFEGEDYRIRRLIGFSPELPMLPPYLTGKECLETYARMRGFGKESVKKVTRDLLSSVELTENADNRTSAYSRGMLAKLDLAISMIGDPEILILDEPTAGLDPMFKRSFMQMLQREVGKDRTIIMSTHQLSDVQKYCRSATVIHHGKTIAEKEIGDLLKTAASRRDYILEVGQNAQLAEESMRKIRGILSLKIGESGTIFISTENVDDPVDRISSTLLELGIGMRSFREVPVDLEDAFAKLVGHSEEK